MPKTTLTQPGCGSRAERGNASKAPRIATGTIGTCAAVAMLMMPGCPAAGRPVRDILPREQDERLARRQDRARRAHRREIGAIGAHHHCTVDPHAEAHDRMLK